MEFHGACNGFDGVASACEVAFVECSAAAMEAERAANQVAPEVDAVHLARRIAMNASETWKSSSARAMLLGATHITSLLREKGPGFLYIEMKNILGKALDPVAKKAQLDASSTFRDFACARTALRDSLSHASALAARAATMQDMIDQCQALLIGEPDSSVTCTTVDTSPHRLVAVLDDPFKDADMNEPCQLNVDDIFALISSKTDGVSLTDIHVQLKKRLEYVKNHVSSLEENARAHAEAAKEASAAYMSIEAEHAQRKVSHDLLVQEVATAIKAKEQAILDTKEASEAVRSLTGENVKVIIKFLEYAKDPKFHEIATEDSGFDEYAGMPFTMFWAAADDVNYALIQWRKAKSALASIRVLMPDNQVDQIDEQVTFSYERIIKYGAAVTRKTIDAENFIGGFFKKDASEYPASPTKRSRVLN